MLETIVVSLQGSSLAMWGLFLVLLVCGLGLPIPEDIVLISAGICGASNDQPWLATAVFMYAGVLIGDSATFLFGRHFGVRLLTVGWVQKLFPPERQERARRRFALHGHKGLFIARFLPGIRAPFFCSAGAMHVPYLRFIICDGIAALVSVPIFVGLGYWLWSRFSENIDELRGAISNTHAWTVIVSAAIGFVVLTLVVIWRRACHNRPASA
jgi:membrane protein DedA with SNARE-associated domain